MHTRQRTSSLVGVASENVSDMAGAPLPLLTRIWCRGGSTLATDFAASLVPSRTEGDGMPVEHNLSSTSAPHPEPAGYCTPEQRARSTGVTLEPFSRLASAACCSCPTSNRHRVLNLRWRAVATRARTAPRRTSSLGKSLDSAATLLLLPALDRHQPPLAVRLPLLLLLLLLFLLLQRRLHRNRSSQAVAEVAVASSAWKPHRRTLTRWPPTFGGATAHWTVTQSSRRPLPARMERARTASANRARSRRRCSR